MPRSDWTRRAAARHRAECRHDGPWPEAVALALAHGDAATALTVRARGRARALARLAAATRRAVAMIRADGPSDRARLVRLSERLAAYRDQAVAWL